MDFKEAGRSKSATQYSRERGCNYIRMLTHGDWKQHKWNELGLWKHYRHNTTLGHQMNDSDAWTLL